MSLLNDESYRHLVSDCEKVGPQKHTNQFWVPVDWNANPESKLFAIPFEYVWQSLRSIIINHETKHSVACLFPAIWQIEPIVQNAAREAGVPSVDVALGGLGLFNAVTNLVGVDVLITSPEYEEELTKNWSSLKNPPRAIVVIHRGVNSVKHWKIDANVYHELHLVPGLPIIFQEQGHILKIENQAFTLNPLLTWSTESVSGNHSFDLPQNFLSPVRNLELSFKLKLDGDSYTIGL